MNAGYTLYSEFSNELDGQIANVNITILKFFLDENGVYFPEQEIISGRYQNFLYKVRDLTEREDYELRELVYNYNKRGIEKDVNLKDVCFYISEANSNELLLSFTSKLLLNHSKTENLIMFQKVLKADIISFLKEV